MNDRRFQILQFTFPHCHSFPSTPSQGSEICGVAETIPFQLPLPVITIGLGDSRAGAPQVQMPKTAINKQHLATRSERQVRAAWEVCSVESIAIAQPVKRLPGPTIQGECLWTGSEPLSDCALRRKNDQA